MFLITKRLVGAQSSGLSKVPRPGIHRFVMRQSGRGANCEPQPPKRGVDRRSGQSVGSVTRVTVYALNLFDIADRDEYLAYSKRSPQEVAKHGGRVVALGRFRESVAGEIEPRNVLVLVEWDSKDAMQ